METSRRHERGGHSFRLQFALTARPGTGSAGPRSVDATDHHTARSWRATRAWARSAAAAICSNTNRTAGAGAISFCPGPTQRPITSGVLSASHLPASDLPALSATVSSTGRSIVARAATTDVSLPPHPTATTGCAAGCGPVPRPRRQSRAARRFIEWELELRRYD
jgi:hypothetical protein